MQLVSVFSSMRKIRTDCRSSMKASTLDAICTMKMYYNPGKNTECHEVRYTRDETNKAKKATMNYKNTFSDT